MLLILIPCVINIIEAIILHNCNIPCNRPFKMVGIIWLLWGIVALIPVTNIISAVSVGIYMCMNFADGYLTIRISDHWLFKRY